MVGVALAARGIWRIRNQFNSAIGMVQVPRASILGLWHRFTNLKRSRSDRIPTATFEGRVASDTVFSGEVVSRAIRASFPDTPEERIAWLKSRMDLLIVQQDELQRRSHLVDETIIDISAKGNKSIEETRKESLVRLRDFATGGLAINAWSVTLLLVGLGLSFVSLLVN